MDNRLSFYWIDAFTSSRFQGNPCAVVFGSDHLSETQMQTVAREINLSETAFVQASEKADFKVRYFTPQEELPFAGHPTVATVHGLVDSGKVDRARVTLTLETQAGLIPIELQARAEETRVTMSQLAPEFLQSYEVKDFAEVFGLAPDDFLAAAPIQTVSTGTPILMIPLANLEVLKRVRYVDSQRYLELKAGGDFSFAHHFCLQGATSQGQTFARSLPTPPATLEDSFTGSATGCMAAYLWRYGFVQETRFIAEQGHWMGRPGTGEVERIGSADHIRSIKLTGSAVTLIKGRIQIPHKD